MRDLLVLAGAGAAGTLARYYVGLWALRQWGDRFAWWTLGVNVVGSFALGLIMQIGLTTDAMPRQVRVALSVGFLGAFTTFSTFTYETARYAEAGAWWTAAANVVAHLGLGLLAAIAGLALGRAIVGPG